MPRSVEPSRSLEDAPDTDSLDATRRRQLEPGPPAATDAKTASRGSTVVDLASSDTVQQHPSAAPAALAATPGSHPRPVDLAAGTLDDAGFTDRYAFRSVLGEGGMGEVRLYRDQRIGRDVAVKVLRRSPRPASSERPPSSDAEPRFLREARVQGQLEHPAIVPVYDLGRAADGEAFFTMKRVRGQTLEEIIAGLRSGDPATTQRHSRRKMLNAFTQVCLAVDFAHSRGVVHRDLKPGNVMLGDFGEVYVLDWGIARIAGVADLPGEPAAEGVIDDDGTRTAEGELLGTPGYMSPEQVRGEGDVDRTTDVYALGCILFEALALEPLHRRTSVTAILASTLKGIDARPSQRAPDLAVAPELDAICTRATALDRSARFSSARELCDEVERYLDGDRDLARRRELADGHAARATEAATKALASDTKDDLELRREAMREAGSALALEPGHHSAIRTVVDLLTSPPRVVPEEALAAQREGERTTLALAGRRGALSYLAWLALAPMFYLMGLRQPALLLAGVGAVACAAVLSFAISLFPDRRDVLGYCVLAIGSVGVVCFGATFAGPLLVLPMLAIGHTVGFVLRPGHWHRVALLVAGIATVVVPTALEWSGLIPASYAFGPEGMLVLPGLTELPETGTRALLLVAAVGTIVINVLFTGHMRDSLAAAERATQVHAWHLRQLVPEVIHGVAPARPQPSCIIHGALHGGC